MLPKLNARGFINSFFLLGIVVLIIGGGAAYYFFSNKESGPSTQKSSEGESLVIYWAEWEPANQLRELVKDFTEETGIKVEVKSYSWDVFQDETFKTLDAKKADFDMVVGDSQWVGRGSTDGHYVELTNWMKERGVDQKMDQKFIEAYGEYPKGGGKYWAVPMEADALGWAYRKDLFEDPKEKAAFKAKYKFDLAVPETTDQLRDIAEFFNRPKDGLYGVGLPTGIEHDTITMGIEGFIWAYGGSLGDYKNFKVKGILNSPESVEGLEMYKKLYKFTPPGMDNAFYTEPQKAYTKGEVAMFMTYFAFMPDLANAKINKYSKETGYFKAPAGPKAQVTALGGQGISINSYTKKKEASLKFLEWFIQDKAQEKWAELGGYSCNTKVLSSEKFLNATPYNRAFAESLGIMRDFWAVPEYAELLKSSQKNWSEYVTTDKVTAEESLDKIAKDWENTFEYAGYYKE